MIDQKFFDFNCTDFQNEEGIIISYQKQVIKKYPNGVMEKFQSSIEHFIIE